MDSVNSSHNIALNQTFITLNQRYGVWRVDFQKHKPCDELAVRRFSYRDAFNLERSFWASAWNKTSAGEHYKDVQATKTVTAGSARPKSQVRAASSTLPDHYVTSSGHPPWDHVTQQQRQRRSTVLGIAFIIALTGRTHAATKTTTDNGRAPNIH